MNKELVLWEEEQLEKIHERWEPSKKRRDFDPYFERLKKRRRHHWRCACTEAPYNRKKWQRKFKMKMRQGIEKEEYYNPVPHDYKTYGWLTW